MAFPAKSRTRTTPTVKPLVTMNKKNTQSWELKLALPQLVVLVGVLTGSMACAFGIGYVTGQKIGFENALASSVSSLPKYPIASSSADQLEADDVRDVYAKMQADPFADESVLVEEKALPELEPIKPAEEQPVVDDLVVDLLNEQNGLDQEEEQDQGVQVRVLGTGSSSGETLAGKDKPKTLGGMLNKENPKLELNTETGSIKQKPVKESGNDSVIVNSEIEDSKTEIAKIVDSTPSMPVEDSPAPEKELPAPEPIEDLRSDTASAFVRSPLPRGWYAQIAAPQSIADADGLAARLSSSGFPVAIEKAVVRGEAYYRVLVGPEENRRQGEILLEQVKRERYLTSQPFIRMVK